MNKQSSTVIKIDASASNNSSFKHHLSTRDTVKNTESFYFTALEKYSSRRQTIRLGHDLMATTHLQHFRADFGGVRSVRYVADERVAVGFYSGHLLVYSLNPPYPAITLAEGWEGNYEVSCLRTHASRASVLYAATAEGTVRQCDLASDTVLHTVVSEEGNEINSFDLSEKGDTLATGGIDATIRVYDANTRKLIQRYGRQRASSHSINSDIGGVHDQRVYCVKRHPNEPCLFASGGWDRTVKLWDVRVGRRCVRNITGPYTFGETLDINGGSLVTASCEPDGEVELWDLGSGDLVDTVSLCHKDHKVPFTAQFFKGDPSGDLVLVGGWGPGLQVISLRQSAILYLFEEERPIVAVDSTDTKIAFGGKSRSIAFSRVSLHENKFGEEREITNISMSPKGSASNAPAF